MRKKLHIVGGGITGCFAANFLKKDFDVQLYEASSSLGGLAKVHYNLEGLPYQKGAHVLYTNEDWIHDLFNTHLPMQTFEYNVAIDPLFDFRYYTFPFNKEAIDMMPWHWSEAIALELGRVDGKTANNLRDLVINFYGETIFEKFHEGYFNKLFGSDAADLKGDWYRKFLRPIETNGSYYTEKSYFPIGVGYEEDFFKKLTDGATVHLNSKKTKNDFGDDDLIICTVRPDHFFFGIDCMKFVMLAFDVDSTYTLPSKPDTIIYPNHVPFVSITQFGRMFPQHNKNIIVKDYVDGDEVAYPVPNGETATVMKDIKDKYPGIYLIGQQGSCQIMSMAECVKQAAQTSAEIKHKER